MSLRFSICCLERFNVYCTRRSVFHQAWRTKQRKNRKCVYKSLPSSSYLFLFFFWSSSSIVRFPRGIILIVWPRLGSMQCPIHRFRRTFGFFEILRSILLGFFSSSFTLASVLRSFCTFMLSLSLLHTNILFHHLSAACARASKSIISVFLLELSISTVFFVDSFTSRTRSPCLSLSFALSRKLPAINNRRGRVERVVERSPHFACDMRANNTGNTRFTRVNACHAFVTIGRFRGKLRRDSLKLILFVN